MAGEQAIERVRGSGDKQHQQSPRVFLIEDEDQKKRQEAEAKEGDLIGYCPDPAFHWIEFRVKSEKWEGERCAGRVLLEVGVEILRAQTARSSG